MRVKPCLILSAVAGLSSWKLTLAPLSVLALRTASWKSECHRSTFSVYINLDGPEDRCCEEKGRFPDSLARVNGPWVGSPSEEADVELGGHVVEAGDLVGARASGEEGTLGGVEQLLHNKKTVTLV